MTSRKASVSSVDKRVTGKNDCPKIMKSRMGNLLVIETCFVYNPVDVWVLDYVATNHICKLGN